MTQDDRASDHVSGGHLWLCRAPLLIAAALVLVINGWHLARSTFDSAPRNPWESIEVVEAYRSLHELPVYELAPDGHATHIYGALMPWLQGEIFRWVGPNNVSGRALSLLGSLATVAMLALVFRGDRSAWYFAIAFALYWGLNHQSDQYFNENRPDMPAFAAGTLALLLLALGLERRRLFWTALGTAVLVVGFFLKQNVAVLAAVPSVALLSRGRRPALSEAIGAAAPLAAMAATFVALKIFQPAVYHYMVAVLEDYKIHWSYVPGQIWALFLDAPLFLLLLGEWIVVDRASWRDRPRVAWLAAALVVTVPFCVVARVKVGGWTNSLLPAWLTMVSFIVLRLPRFLTWVDDRSRPLRARLALAAFLAVLMLMTAFPHLALRIGRSPRNQEYPEIIARARALPGTVVCPVDNTIPLYARGYVARNLFAEKDAHPKDGQWSPSVPERILDDLQKADYVVDAIGYWDRYFSGETLRELGFEPMDDGANSLTHYRIWRRARPGSASGPTTSAGPGPGPKS